MSNIYQSNEDHLSERKWFIDHFSRGLREDIVYQLQQDFIEQQKVRVPWPEQQFRLFPNGNIVWNIQKILLDDVDNWDGNLELVLVKEKLGLVQFFSLSCNNKNIPHHLVSHRKIIVSGLIAKQRLCNV